MYVSRPLVTMGVIIVEGRDEEQWIKEFTGSGHDQQELHSQWYVLYMIHYHIHYHIWLKD